MKGLYIVGGRQRELRPIRAGQQPWQGYDRGLVLYVDPVSRSVSTCFEYSRRVGDLPFKVRVSRHDLFAKALAA